MLEFYKMKICNFLANFVYYYVGPMRGERVALVVCTVYSQLESSFFMFFLAKLSSVTESTQVYS